MKTSVTLTVGSMMLAGLFEAPVSFADSLFTIEDPPVDFEVIDADDGGEHFFDGIGDFGPFYTFNDAVLGSFGEARSMAEFDISPFTVPPGEYISAARFEVELTSISVFGLGVDGEIPESLAVDGYVGDGTDELSDFQIADGNRLLLVRGVEQDNILREVSEYLLESLGAVVFFALLMGITFFIGWAVSWYLETTEKKK